MNPPVSLLSQSCQRISRPPFLCVFENFQPRRPTLRYATYFVTYEVAKRLLTGKKLGDGEGASSEGGEEASSKGSDMFNTAIAGGLAGICAWLPIYPGKFSLRYPPVLVAPERTHFDVKCSQVGPVAS